MDWNFSTEERIYGRLRFLPASSCAPLWNLEVAGQKTHNLYLYNGLALFVGWLAARVILFIYFFTHMFFHFDQVKSIFTLGFYSILTVPPALAVMNLFWFWKIFKGMLKTLSKRRQHTENGKSD